MARSFKQDINNLTEAWQFDRGLDVSPYNKGKSDYDSFISGMFLYTFAVYRIKGAGAKYADTMRLMSDGFYKDLLKSVEEKAA